jgi:hypothetical protein
MLATMPVTTLEMALQRTEPQMPTSAMAARRQMGQQTPETIKQSTTVEPTMVVVMVQLYRRAALVLQSMPSVSMVVKLVAL